MWEVETTDAFDDWWQKLTEQEQDDVTAVVELLEERGAHLPFPHSSGIQGSRFSHMRELRIQSHGDPIRVFLPSTPAVWRFFSLVASRPEMRNGFTKSTYPERIHCMRNT
jgi:hypothetical protein